MKLKKIISIILLVALVLAIGAGVSTFAKREYKTIHPVFTRGSLDENGKYVETNESIFTKEMFECLGLTIETDVKFKGEYKVYFYNSEGAKVGEAFEDSEGTVVNVPEAALYARIVITPDIEGDEIAFWQVPKFSSQLKIKVLKNQEVEIINYFELDEDYEAGTVVCYSGAGASGSIAYIHQDYDSNVIEGSLVDVDDYRPLEPIDITGWEKIGFIFPTAEARDIIYFFAGEDLKVRPLTGSGNTQHRFWQPETNVVLDIPDDSKWFYCNTLVDEDAHFIIYKAQ